MSLKNLKTSQNLSHIKIFLYAWRKKNFLNSIIFLLAATACFGLLFLFAKFSEPREWQPIATKSNGQIDFGREFGPMIFGGAMILLFLNFLIKFMKALFPPIGNRSIEKTVKTFFNSAFDGVQANSWGTLNSSIEPKDMGAMLVISSSAFEKIGGWPGFVEYWSKQRSNLQEKISDIFNVNIKKMKISSVDYSNYIKKVEVNIPSTTQNKILKFTTVLEIEKINDKWFLTFADCKINFSIEKVIINNTVVNNKNNINAVSERQDDGKIRRKTPIPSIQKFREDKPEELINNGIDYMDKNESKKAIDCFQKAIDIKINSLEAWFNMGNAYMDMKSHEKAIECYHKAVDINPDDSDIWCNLGNAYGAQGEHDKAIESYQNGININPNDSDLLNGIGEAYESIGEKIKANEYFEKAKNIILE